MQSFNENDLIIPARILNARLSHQERLLWGLIHSVSKTGEPFEGSDSWLAESLHINLRQAMKTLTFLDRKGFIIRTFSRRKMSKAKIRLIRAVIPPDPAKFYPVQDEKVLAAPPETGVV